MNIDKLRNKKIGILGYGINNQALFLWLVKNGVKDITICDKKQDIAKKFSIFNFQFSNKFQIPKIKFQTGRNYLDNLERFDVVFRTPGIPYLHPKIQKAKRKGVEISSQTKLFFDLCPAKIIGITGTKGKGTTAVLIHEILLSASEKCHSERSRGIPFKSDFSTEFHSSRNDKCLKYSVYLAGNIGTDPFEFLDRLTKNDWVILELSSFQLQDLHKSPHIAVVLNITSDHLDYHKNTKEYIEAKLNIVRYQSKKDYTVINLDYLTSFKFAAASPTKNDYYFSTKKSVDLGTFITSDKITLRILDSGQARMTSRRDSLTNARNDSITEFEICKASDVKLLGTHNLENVCAAITASFLAGADIASIKKIITAFAGREHGLEFVREHNGVKYYNDSASTNPDTVIAAIKSFNSPIILIAGGSDKGADYSKLGKEISRAKNIKKIILIGKTARKIVSSIKYHVSHEKQFDNLAIKQFDNFDKAVNTAIKSAKSGDIVLLSPASASFDMFKNYEERGERFKKIVNKL